jgi:pyruvoyl-dependent arginine decarboxylase (PvlArgDC)
MLRFLAGAIAGALAVWMWGDDLHGYLAEKTRGVRTRTADQIQALATAAEQIESTIRPADDNHPVGPAAR